jgi:hypothetical protein
MNLKRISITLLLTATAALVLGLLTASPPAHAAIGSGTPIPAAPSNLTAKAVGTTSVKLTWTNNATNQSGVVISLDGVTSVDVPGATVSSYTWKGLSPGTRYWFYIASKIYGTPGDPTGPGNTQSAWVGPVYATTATSSSTPCDFTLSLKTCKSTDPTVSYTSNATGDTSHCTFVFNITWGDGGSTTKTETDPTDGHHLIGDHKYAAPGVYTIKVKVKTTAGTCTATSSVHTFTLPPATPSKCGNGQCIWSGWGTSVVQDYTGITGDFKVPTVKGKKGIVGIWLGLGGDSTCPDPLEQIGISAEIVKGKAVYRAWWENISTCQNLKSDQPHYFKQAIKPGDSIHAAVTYSSPPTGTNGTFWLYLKDVTRGWSEKVPVSAPEKSGSESGRQSAEAIVEDFERGPLPDFGTVGLRNIRIYPSPKKDYGWTQQNPIEYHAWNLDKVNVAPVSSTGDFNVTWEHP